MRETSSTLAPRFISIHVSRREDIKTTLYVFFGVNDVDIELRFSIVRNYKEMKPF